MSYDEGEKVQYVGMSNDFARRQSEQPFDISPYVTGLSRENARAVEQVLVERYGLGKNGGQLLNKINSIASDNPFIRELSSEVKRS